MGLLATIHSLVIPEPQLVHSYVENSDATIEQRKIVLALMEIEIVRSRIVDLCPFCYYRVQIWARLAREDDATFLEPPTAHNRTLSKFEYLLHRCFTSFTIE